MKRFLAVFLVTLAFLGVVLGFFAGVQWLADELNAEWLGFAIPAVLIALWFATVETRADRRNDNNKEIRS